MRQARSIEEEINGFANRVMQLRVANQPVRLLFGCGVQPIEGFLNLDHRPMVPDTDPRFPNHEFFFFPYTDMVWPIPDNSVDYIFHEDFIEHVTQKQQVCLFAEALRVLKPGSWHRVSTPCLLASMKRHSHLAAGIRGVYTGEWDIWGHVNLFTRASLEEMARMVGYREVVFNMKNQGVSPFRAIETRPGDDRDPILGNIFADLLK